MHAVRGQPRGEGVLAAGDSNNECLFATPGTGICQVYKIFRDMQDRNVESLLRSPIESRGEL